MDSLIDPETLEQMKAAYLSHPARLKINGQDLKGFSLNADKVQQVLNQPGVTDVFIMFGVRPEDLGKPQEEQSFTVAYAGIVDNQLTGVIYDYCDPCPG